jgi:hypothetical protein
MKEAMEVKVAAIPTRAWKAATVWGRSVIGTFLPIVVPTTVAAPRHPRACIITGPGKDNSAKAVTIPPAIPVIPIAEPSLAVVISDNPAIPPMQHNDDKR